MRHEEDKDPTPGGNRIDNVQAPGAVIINGNVGDNTTINAAPPADASAANPPRNKDTVEHQIIHSAHSNQDAMHPDLRDGMQALHEFMMLLRNLDR